MVTDEANCRRNPAKTETCRQESAWPNFVRQTSVNGRLLRGLSLFVRQTSVNGGLPTGVGLGELRSPLYSDREIARKTAERTQLG
jgi:hypothetical protein